MTKRAFGSGLGAVLALATLCPSAAAQVPSDARREGLYGPVREVRRTVLSYNWEDDRWADGLLPAHGGLRFDRSGRRVDRQLEHYVGWTPVGAPLPPATANGPGRYEVVRPPRDGGMGWKTVWLFDALGRLERFESYAIYEHGPELSNWEQFAYDDLGRVCESASWADWGRSPEQTEPYPPIRKRYLFDDAGRIAGWFDPGEPRSRAAVTYDGAGRATKLVEETWDPGIIYVLTTAWRRYDAYGNWGECARTEAWRTDEGDDPQSRIVERRTISYDDDGR